MTLLFMDSGYGVPTGRYSGSPTMASGAVNASFPGGYARSNSTSSTMAGTATFTAASDVIACVRSTQSGSTSTPSIAFAGDAGATTHITIIRNSSGFLEARRGTSAGTLLATGATNIPNGVMVHIQARATIADSGGTVQVRLNGLTTNEIDFTGDTKNAGTNSTIDAVTFSGVNTSPASLSMADMIVLNTAGSVNNTWPGDVVARVILPTGNGATSQGVNSAATSTNNYTYVNETVPSSTGYVGITTNGQGDSYAFGDLPAGSTTILAVQAVAYAAKSDAGAKSAKLRTRIGSTTYTGPSKTLSTTYQSFTDLAEVSPATGTAWTASEVNGAEFGAEAA